MSESAIVEIRAVLRTERLSRVLHALEEAGVPRATVHPVLDVVKVRTGARGPEALE